MPTAVRIPAAYPGMGASSRPQSRLDLAVVIPTYQEKPNIALLVAALDNALTGLGWEAIFVDDNSPDGTAEHIREIAVADRRVRVLERIGRRGLSSACIEGMLTTAAPYIAVMDADLQHDESILPRMLQLIRSEDLDVVVASRKIAGGSMGDFSPQRVRLSNLGGRISSFVCRCHTSDPMSGFFVVRRSFFQSVVSRLTGSGFKILVDILASSRRPVRIADVPYHFRTRAHGESKLDINVELDHLFLLLDKTIGTVIPTRFALFLMVGALGLVVHFACLAVLYRLLRLDFIVGQAAATTIAMTFNFLINNVVAFRDQRLRGWRLLAGLFTFYVACSLGALANVSVAGFLHRSGIPWYFAGIAGIAISSVWNYAANSVMTWRRSRT